MGAYSVDGGLETTRLADDDELRQRVQDGARTVISRLVEDEDVRGELCDMLGIAAPADQPESKPVPAKPAPSAPAATPDGSARVVATVRPARKQLLDEDWRHFSACRDVDPEAFFPVGTSGPALLQIEQAKDICRRCDVQTDCLIWALESGQDHGIAGGMSEEERRDLKKRDWQKELGL